MIPAQWVYHFSVMCNWVSQRYLKNAVKHLFEIWTVPNLSSAHDTLSWSLFLIFLLLKKKKKICLIWEAASPVMNAHRYCATWVNQVYAGSSQAFRLFLTALPTQPSPSHCPLIAHHRPSPAFSRLGNKASQQTGSQAKTPGDLQGWKSSKILDKHRHQKKTYRRWK